MEEGRTQISAIVTLGRSLAHRHQIRRGDDGETLQTRDCGVHVTLWTRDSRDVHVTLGPST